jgi:ATP-dependent Clp protease protease subunit
MTRNNDMTGDRYVQFLRANAKADGKKPLAVVKSGDGEEATVYMYDMIVSSELEADWFGGIAPESFVKALNKIDAKTIHLRINSPGGSIFAARAIEAAIRNHPAKIIAHVDGVAASAASFVAVACDAVEIAKGGFFMVHKGWCCMCGNSDDALAMADLLDKLDGTIAQTYADKSGKPASDMLELMAAETWLTAEESLEIGFADRIAESEAKNCAWDLSAYENAPLAVVPEEASEAEHDKEENASAGKSAAMLRNRLALKEREQAAQSA